MANMRTRYSATVTASATQLKPTQITARQAACISRNGSTRAQSTCLPESAAQLRGLRPRRKIAVAEPARQFAAHALGGRRLDHDFIFWRHLQFL